jgi:hypothetical protein
VGDRRAGAVAVDVAYPFDHPWRVGRKVGRTIYVQEGDDPSDEDMLIGVMDTEYLAELVVEAVNAQRRA